MLNARGKFVVDDRIYLKGLTAKYKGQVLKVKYKQNNKDLVQSLAIFWKKATSCQAETESQLFHYFKSHHTHTQKNILLCEMEEVNNSFTKLAYSDEHICSPCLKCGEDTVEVDKGLKPL